LIQPQTLKSLNNNKKLNGRIHHIPLNINTDVNGINSPIKRQHLVNWVKKEDPTICHLQETQFIERNKH
jgi:hypothetical protein